MALHHLPRSVVLFADRPSHELHCTVVSRTEGGVQTSTAHFTSSRLTPEGMDDPSCAGAGGMPDALFHEVPVAFDGACPHGDMQECDFTLVHIRQ